MTLLVPEKFIQRIMLEQIHSNNIEPLPEEEIQLLKGLKMYRRKNQYRNPDIDITYKGLPIGIWCQTCLKLYQTGALDVARTHLLMEAGVIILSEREIAWLNMAQRFYQYIHYPNLILSDLELLESINSWTIKERRRWKKNPSKYSAFHQEILVTIVPYFFML